MPLNKFMAGVAPDPLPWLTERFAEYGVYDPEASDVVRLSRILGVAQSTVNALSDGKRSFRVKFSNDAGTAYTDGRSHTVAIGVKPALDPDLTDGQRAAILIAMAAHEVGHVRWSVSIEQRLQEHYAADRFKQAWALRVFNIAHDIHLEHWMREDFPVLRDVLDLKGLYFCSPWVFDGRRNVTRYGALINATLYPHATDWTVSPEAAAFKAWADEWAVKVVAKAARTLKGAIEVIEEALTFLRYDEQPDEPPEDKPMNPEDWAEDEDDEDDEWDEDEDDGDPSEGDDESEDDESDSEDGDDDSEDEDDESESDEDGDDSEGSDDFDEDDDEWREGKGGSSNPPESREDESEDEDGDESEDEGGSDSFGAESEDGEGEKPERWDDDEYMREHVDDGGETTSYTDAAPVPSLHGDMHTADDADWQDAIDAYQRTQTSMRDRHIVGGGPFRYREMRVVRIRKG